MRAPTAFRHRRPAAIVGILLMIAPSCGSSASVASPDDTVTSTTTVSAVDRSDGVELERTDGVAATYDPASMVSFRGTLEGADLALTLDSTTTGVIGGVRADECPGDPADPYGRLVPSSGELVIDETYIERSLGGERLLQNFDVLGAIIIEADDVTLRCGRVHGNEPYTIDVRSEGVRLEWVEASQDDKGKTVLGGGFEAYRCDITGGEDGFHINRSGATITECYVHDQNFIGEDPHPDAVQASSQGVVDHVTVVRSKLISFYKAPNASLQINVADEWSVVGSYLWGGVFSVLGDPNLPGTVTDNYFGWDSSQYGAVGGVDSTRSSNVWWEWSSPKCSGDYSAEVCATPADHPGNGTPVE